MKARADGAGGLLHGNEQAAAFAADAKEENVCGLLPHFCAELGGVFDGFSVHFVNDVAGLESGFGSSAAFLDFGDNDAFNIRRQLEVLPNLRREVGAADPDFGLDVFLHVSGFLLD